MRNASAVRPRLLAVLGLVLLVPAPAQAHRMTRGYHCALGQYWRPSLGICQDHPYGAADRTAPVSGSFSASARPSGAYPPKVSTQTRVVSRSRIESDRGVVVRYVVQTSVVEKYDKTQVPPWPVTRVSFGPGN